MLINFSVTNFASIKEKQTLSFEATKSKDLEEYYIVEPIKGLRLLKMACIYGANASGKSNILKALNFIRECIVYPIEKKVDKLKFEPFLLDTLTPKQNTIFELEFIQKSIRFSYKVELNQEAIISEELYSYNPKKSKVFARGTNVDKQYTNINFGKKIKIDETSKKILEANTLWNNTVFGGYSKTNIYITELKDIIEWFSGNFTTIINYKIEIEDVITTFIVENVIDEKFVIDTLQKTDFNILNISFEQNEKKNGIDVFFEYMINNQKYKLPMQLQSQGTQRYYGLAGLLSLLIGNSMFLPIDELEASLHPDLLRHFILSFLQNAKSSQLLFTTHFRELLLDKEILRQDAIWFTEKNKDGATELFSLADFDSSVIRDTTSWYNAYKTGKLGAVPLLKDTYIEQQANGKKK